jgi:D-alanine-D-alanine ligase
VTGVQTCALPIFPINKKEANVAFIPSRRSGQLVNLSTSEKIFDVDVVFPIIHGPYGEDGSLQGLLKMANIPFVGASVLGSAIGMDKDVAKRLLRDAGIPIAEFLVIHRHLKSEFKFENICELVGMPFFVKPVNLGSSVGISKVSSKKSFEHAITEAFKYDNKIIVEEQILGRELECSVLGNENPIASLPGEVVTSTDHEFYTYEAKYIDEHGAVLEIPANLSYSITNIVKEMSIKAFKILCCEGMARVDLFLKNDGNIIVNEINTIPGFTNISMYPKLWEVSGITSSELMDKLIELAIERHRRDSKLKNSLK